LHQCKPTFLSPSFDNRAIAVQSVSKSDKVAALRGHNAQLMYPATRQSSLGGFMLESGDCLFSARYRSGNEKVALFEHMATLPDEDLIRLASLSVQAMQLAADRESDHFLQLAAACNYELVIRRARVGMSS
jgi:hypothetical protein